MQKKMISAGLLCLAGTFAFSAPLVPYRAWQFHALKYDYVSRSMKLAPRYDINTVVFSHGMIGQTSQLYDGTDRGKQLQKLTQEAHTLGLKVWIWIHELDNVPEAFLENKTVQMDRPGFWEWLEKRYDTLFRDYPEFDGLMLTFHETQYKIFREKEVQSRLTMPERFARLTTTMFNVCLKYKKDFIVRTFLYEPIEYQWVKEGLLKCDPRIMIQLKCVPHDWDPYYPNDSLIGAFPKNRQIIEFDCSSEFTGKNRVPYTHPGELEYRWRYDLRQPGVVGFNLRVDHGGYDAIDTPNEINLYAMYRMTEDPQITANGIWKEWTDLRYGRSAAYEIEQALKLSYDVVNKAFFPLHFWITAHSALPGFKYADGHISERTLVKWFPDVPAYKDLEQKLNHPDPLVLEKILTEKDTAIVLAEEALQHLQKAKPYLSQGQYEDLYWRLNLLLRTAMIWKSHAEAFFGYKVLAEGHAIPGLHERVERALGSLYLEAEISQADPRIGDLPPGSAKEIRTVADELKKMLKSLTR